MHNSRASYRDNHRSHCSTGRSGAARRSARVGDDYQYRSRGGQFRDNHLTREEYQQQYSRHDGHRDRSRSPMRISTEGRRQAHRRRESGRDNGCHKCHYNVQRTEISNAFEVWDDERLKYLAKKTDSSIVEILFNDQKGLFGMLGSESFLKDTHKLKMLIQVLHNLCNIEENSEHMTSLLSQIISKKCNLFYSELSMFVRSIPSVQAIKKRDENFEILTQIISVFYKMLNVVPQRCVILPLNDLQATALQLQRINSRYSNCLTSTNELIEIYRGFEAANISGTSRSYRHVAILPEAHEIARKPKVKLQANVIEGSYQNWSHYLHVQFSLLREDFISPLRKGICDYNRGYEDRSRQNIRVYKYVRILEPVCLYTGVGFQIQFDATYGHWRRIEWEHSRRLNFGSLLCLSSDKFANILFATVVSRDPKMLKDGILKVQFENANISKLLEISPETEFTMVESTAYFEAYRHILTRLQSLEENPPSFKSYIVDCKPLEFYPPPSYLTVKDIEDKEDVCFDLSALGYPHSVNVLNPQDWPHFDEGSLDKSQLTAVRMALTQEISVIQGPPGTGKTYIGLKIVEILLHNKGKWDPFLQSPILIVCYTNHALDQFLEGILKFNKKGESVNMVRVGGRCRSEAIQPYNLQVLVRQHKADRRHCSEFEQIQLRTAKHTMDSKHQEITKKLHKVSALIAKDEPIILELHDLEPVIFSKHIKQLEAFAELCGVTDANKKVETWLLSTLNQSTAQNEEKAQIKHTNPKPSEVPMEVADETLNDGLVDDMDGEADHLESDRIIDGEQIVLEPTVYEKEPSSHKTPDRRPDNISKQIRKGMKAKPLTKEEAQDIEDITQLSCTQKWSLYQHWVNLFVQRCKRKATSHVETYATACKEFQRARTELDYAVMHDAHVVGMTTTGAAKYHSILQKLRPKIIIIEEAAEVLESHVVTTLTASTQQVIMIGDHQQLRPKPNDYHLATEYNLEVSLFERLTKNDFPYATLEVQHRMRPEIVQLISPHIYENLINAAEVHEYEEIKGIKHNLFFIDHNVAEDDNGKEMMSHSNEFEVGFAVQLCCYFIKRGYYQHQITILTMYSGQVLKIKKMLRQNLITEVRISSVDDFQGEENDIIILSLVRSNKNGRVGFLKEPNRVCVALSRAKMGLFVIGNFSMLKKEGGTKWPGIIEDMEKKQLLANNLPLFCSFHSKTTMVSSGEDISTKAPEGGCAEICGIRLSCGHSCPLICHPGSKDHSFYKCRKKCAKTLSCPHKCRGSCFECKNQCIPCKVMITKSLPCGHTRKLECSMADSISLIVSCLQYCAKELPCGHKCKNFCSEPCTTHCKELVIKKLPCGHSTKKKVPCSKPFSSIKCFGICKEILSCGHQCSGNCSTCYKGKLHRPCDFKCGRTLPCGHMCTFPCTNECPPCSKPCKNYCNHSRCDRRCGEPCVPCREDCQWRCSHFKCSKTCGEMCDRPRCDKPCNKLLLKCKHPCIGLCGEKCPRWCRKCHPKQVNEIFFGTEDEPNARFIQLEDCGHIFEVSGLDHWMDQQDNSTDSKAIEIQFKCCPKCKTNVRRSLRYGNIIKQTLYDMEKVKQKVRYGNGHGDHTHMKEIKESMYHLKGSQYNPRWDYVKQFLNAIEDRIQQNYSPHHSYSRLPKNLTFHEINTVTFQLKNLPKVFKLFDFVLQLHQKFTFNNLKFSTQDIKNQLDVLCDFMTMIHLSEQNKSDIEFEFNRLSALFHLCELCNSLKHANVTKEHLDFINKMATDILCKEGYFTQRDKITTDFVSEFSIILEEIGKMYGVGCITQQERMEIVKAVGLSKGHWFKCPNGHYYCIGECGGAMQLAKCPECKTDIGGTSHSLTAGNTHAPEMDGSCHAAWSDAANLRNYDPADIMEIN